MRYETIGRGLRSLRHRRGLRQEDAARIAGISRSVLGDLEHGHLEPHALGALVRAASAVGASLRVDLVVPGADLHRLLDADHAAIQESWSGMLAHAGWDVAPEATFNHHGERGSVDILAWHPSSRVLLVVEIKTLIVDLQDLLAGVDRKGRAGRRIAVDRGWSPASVVPLLLVPRDRPLGGASWSTVRCSLASPFAGGQRRAGCGRPHSRPPGPPVLHRVVSRAS